MLACVCVCTQCSTCACSEGPQSLRASGHSHRSSVCFSAGGFASFAALVMQQSSNLHNGRKNCGCTRQASVRQRVRVKSPDLAAATVGHVLLTSVPPFHVFAPSDIIYHCLSDSHCRQSAEPVPLLNCADVTSAKPRSSAMLTNEHSLCCIQYTLGYGLETHLHIRGHCSFKFTTGKARAAPLLKGAVVTTTAAAHVAHQSLHTASQAACDHWSTYVRIAFTLSPSTIAFPITLQAKREAAPLLNGADVTSAKLTHRRRMLIDREPQPTAQLHHCGV